MHLLARAVGVLILRAIIDVGASESLRLQEAGAGTAAVLQWRTFGRVLTAQRWYANPYTDVELIVTLGRPGAGPQNRTALGFWDGGGAAHSVWRWSTFFATPGVTHTGSLATHFLIRS